MNGRSVARAVDVRQQLAKILRERLRIDPEVRMEHVVSVWICVCVFVCHGDGAKILHLRCFSQGLASYVVRKPSDLLFTRLFEPCLFRGRHRVIMILGASLRRSALKCKRCAHDVKNVVRHHIAVPRSNISPLSAPLQESCGAEMSQYLRCLVAGLFTNVAQRQPSASGGGGRGCYRTVIGGRRVPCSFGLRRRRVGRAAIVSSAVVCFASPSSGASTSWLFLAWRQVGVRVSLLLDHTDHTKGGLFFRHTVVCSLQRVGRSLCREVDVDLVDATRVFQRGRAR